MSKVEVLCPNGHRVSVKTTPNTKLIQVLEEACAKKDFLPASDYSLKHGKKTLDLTLSVRYAGLPNLAKLELVKSQESREEKNVIIALQLPSGERLQHEFPGATSLWDILLHWETQKNSSLAGTLACVTENGHHPVCVYMREEVVGEYALRHTTLRQLGLTGGRAIIRILHRAVNEKTLKSIQDTIDEQLARQNKIIEKSRSIEDQVADNSLSIGAESSATNQTISSSKHSVRGPSALKVDENSSPQDVPSSSAAAMETEHEAESVRNMQPKKVESRSKNSDLQPMEVESSGSLDASVATTSQLSETSMNAHGGVQIAPGVQMFRPGESQLTDDEQRILRQATLIAQNLMPNNAFPQQDRAEMDRLRAERRAQIEWEREQRLRLTELLHAQPLSEFKFPEETAGHDLYKNEWSDVQRAAHKPCERETVLYHMEHVPDHLQRPQHDDVTDEFFEVTEQDVKKLWADSQKQLRAVNEEMLMTKSMRAAQKEVQMSRYERVVIRIQFADKLVLQGLFRPREPVHDLYKYVSTHLEDSNQEFYLYTAPPKCVLKDQSVTLIEADLVPMSVVYFGSEKTDQCLSGAVLETQSSLEEANEVLVNYMQSKGAESSEKKDGGKQSTGSKARNPSTSGTSTGETKTPKWFKIGKK